MEALVELEGVWFRYSPDAPWALRGVTLNLGEGRVLVAGPTGGGKSTLLRVASGVYEAYPYYEIRGRVSRRVRVALLPQVFDLYILMPTVREELYYSLENAGVPGHLVPREARRVAEALGIDHLMDRMVSELSAGERQRVAIASALASGAEALMLDEPLAYLDPRGASGLLGALEASGARLVVVAEHRVHALESWPERLVYIEGGRVAYDGPAGRGALGSIDPTGGAGLWGVWGARAALQASGCTRGGPRPGGPGDPPG